MNDAPPQKPEQIPDGNISPCLHRNLNSMLLILLGVLAVFLLSVIQQTTVDFPPLTRLFLVLTVAILSGIVIWWLRPRFMRKGWRARCPACGKTMDYGYQPWPVAEGHFGPDFEQGVYYLEYRCRACGATRSCSLLKRLFPFYHQIVNFSAFLIFFSFFVKSFT